MGMFSVCFLADRVISMCLKVRKKPRLSIYACTAALTMAFNKSSSVPNRQYHKVLRMQPSIINFRFALVFGAAKESRI